MAVAYAKWTPRKTKDLLFGQPFLSRRPADNRHVGIGIGKDIVGEITGLCKAGRLKEAVDVLPHLNYPDYSIYVSLLQGCIHNKTLPEGKLVHAHIILTGFNPDVYLGTKLLIMYAKCSNSPLDARLVLNGMPERNVVTWTVMISAYSKHGHHRDALTLFRQMQQQTDIQSDKFVFASVLPACAKLVALQHGKEIHYDVIRSGFRYELIVGTALVDMYVKCGVTEDARRVFNEMPEKDVVLWNAMIAGYANSGRIDEALQLFQKTPHRDVVSWNSMIAGYAQKGRFDEALELFHQIPQRDVVSWNAMIGGYAQNGLVDEALDLFLEMPEPDVISWNSMIAGYAQNGLVDEALDLFLEMPEPDVISWNSMIAGYVQNGYADEGLKVFHQMQMTGVKPNSITFATLLPACANLAALEQGKAIHDIINRSEYFADAFVGCALVDMYVKCGSIEDARNVFDKLPKRDVVHWTAMILGYAMHGHVKEALHLFEQMQSSGVRPNNVTFVGVLSACCHAGLVDEGLNNFDLMTQHYHIVPEKEHYCCMVDLLGRAGQLDKAQNFINELPVKPDAAIWASLLSACKIHNNIKLGESVAEYLLASNTKNAAHYVLLSNIYAAAGRWDDVEKVRKVMKANQVTKSPGCSWIKINDKAYCFLVGDRSNPHLKKIYVFLEKLSVQMKEAGYVPDTNFVLHDVEDEQKEYIIYHHSEKLAIAFGLLYSSPGTPIRIVKNLRVCGDCHSAAKFISKIVAREIFLRDANRYHHFKDGECSCGDYW